jgi:hypothetical protein
MPTFMSSTIAWMRPLSDCRGFTPYAINWLREEHLGGNDETKGEQEDGGEGVMKSKDGSIIVSLLDLQQGGQCLQFANHLDREYI